MCEVSPNIPLSPGHCHLHNTQRSELRQLGSGHLSAFVGDILASGL